MDINKLVRSVLLDIGPIIKMLPAEDTGGSPKNYLMEILELKTLPSINRVYPHIVTTYLSRDSLTEISTDDHRRMRMFRMNLEELTGGAEIMSIRSLQPVRSTLGDCHGHVSTTGLNRFGRSSSSALYGAAIGTMVRYADGLLAGSMHKPIQPRFHEPNIIEIDSTLNHIDLFKIELCVAQDINLITFPESGFDQIKQLFLLDVRSTIYNNYNHMDGIETAFGSINLKISDWSGAESERLSLFEKLLDQSHLITGTIVTG